MSLLSWWKQRHCRADGHVWGLPCDCGVLCWTQACLRPGCDAERHGQKLRLLQHMNRIDELLGSLPRAKA